MGKKGKEAYDIMIENVKLGEVCVAEQCFMFIGTSPGEQSLMLCALQQIVQHNREAIYSSFEDKRARRPSIVKSNRHIMLHTIKTKLHLSPTQAKVKYPSN